MMMSLQDMAVVKTAIEICNNNPDLKREILCAPGSDYDLNKVSYEYYNKRQWDKIVEKKATVIVENLGIAKKLQEKVMDSVFAVGMRMLTWAKYHEGALGLSREYGVKFLNNSFFTQQGIIDNKKTAEKLMKDQSLNIKQQYKSASLYCFVEDVSALYNQMAYDDRKEFYNPSLHHRLMASHGEMLARMWQPEVVNSLSYHRMGVIGELGRKPVDEYRLKMAVQSGSKAAVEYWLKNINLIRRKDAIVGAAGEAVGCRVREGRYMDIDQVVFQNDRYNNRNLSLVPSVYYMDILCFLLSKLDEDEQIEFFKIDIEGFQYEKDRYLDQRHSRVLRCFLNWPYQDYFMKKAKLMWEILPERDYATLLLKICDKIEPKEGRQKYGEEKSYDYRELLMEFWCQSPEHYKRYIFSNPRVTYCTSHGAVFSKKVGEEFLIQLLTFKNITYQNVENIKIILASATCKEKENILSSEEWSRICRLMKEEKWEILNRFLQDCSLSKEEENKFKWKLSLTREAKLVCIDFIKKDKWNEVEYFIKWSSLPEEAVSKLKKEIICSVEGKRACVDLISCDKRVEALDKFIRWCFPSGEEVKAFRKELVFSDEGADKCTNLVTRDELELVSEFINFCLSSEEEVRELKKRLACRFGNSDCVDLISGIEYETIYNNQKTKIGTRTIFKGGRWEEVEMFLTWCFSSEKEISEFKKHQLLKVSGIKIHFNLITHHRYEEAETFFAWLGLSAEEIKELKKETLFHYGAASEMFSNLILLKEEYYSWTYPEISNAYGSKQEAVELLLRWYLTDKRTVLEFKNEFKHQFLRKYVGVDGELKTLFQNFDLLIEQRLKDINEEQRGVKRKSEALSQNKKLCNLKLEDKVNTLQSQHFQL